MPHIRGVHSSRLRSNAIPCEIVNRLLGTWYRSATILALPLSRHCCQPLQSMDPITIFIVATLMMLANGAVLGVMHKDLPLSLQPCAETWRVATLLLAGSAVLYAVQYELPLGLVSPMANGMVMLGCTGYWRALRQFDGVPDRWWMLLPALAGIGGVAWFAGVRPDTPSRILLLSGVVALVLMAGTAQLVRGGIGERARSRKALAGLFLLVGLFVAFRAGYFLVRRVGPSFDITGEGAWINAASPLVTALLPVVGTTAFLFMCSQRIGRQWEVAAATDYLTGLANRRTLLAEGEKRFAKAREGGIRLALALVDVDHFKAINDGHGHGVGDRALQHVARQLQATARGLDFVARHGGEEFVVLLDLAHHGDAHAAGERLRLAVAGAPFTEDTASLTITITISVGVALQVDVDATLDQVLRRADDALYVAKRSGRNRVELAAG